MASGLHHDVDMRMMVAGASGFVGRRLLAEAALSGVDSLVLRRGARTPAGLRGGQDCVHWDPGAGLLDPACIHNVDTIVNLCGAGIADRRWSASRRRELRESRLAPTRTLVRALAAACDRPRVLINASAIGYYGSRGEELLTEHSPGGNGFLAELCAEWEEAALAARASGVRVVVLRIGMVLGEGGGALAAMAPAFRRGLGARLGDGRGWTSWIGLEDLVRIILFAATRHSLEGPVNAVAPEPLRQAEFANLLAESLGSHVRLRLPAALLQILFGELGREVLLQGCRVMPRKLEEAGFVHRQGRLGGLLQGLFGS